jgi:hypothetical protein
LRDELVFQSNEKVLPKYWKHYLRLRDATYLRALLLPLFCSKVPSISIIQVNHNLKKLPRE